MNLHIKQDLEKKNYEIQLVFLRPKTMRPHAASWFSIDLTGPGSDLGQLWIQKRLGLIQSPNFRLETAAFRQPTLTTNTGISVIKFHE